jgi:aspartyl-tRNA synthetase
MNAERFYALPQSPQIYKQILMVAGMDRYFQVARCFRDEDLRGDRQPEFTQVDIEVSFATSDDIIRMIEGMVEEIYAQAMDKKITLPLQRMTYAEGMERFGNDKPDTRFGMEIVDATDLMGGTEFGVANSVIEAGGRIRGIAVPDVFSRKQMKDLESMIATFGAKGIMFIKREADGYKSPLTRFYSDEQLTAIMERFGAEEETILLVAGPDKITCPSLSRLRLHLGEACGLIDHNRHDFLWIVDPPLVEFNDDTNSYDPVHHPFTAPLAEDLAKMDTDLASVRADAYDLVLNGNEVAGGSVRIHSRELQKTVFSSIGLDMAAIEEKFGFMLEAFRYGVPPHAGIAYGLDRLLMIMTNTSSIREVMAFPKTTSGGCLMTAAPSFVDNDQLKDLHIRTCGTEKSETSS